MPRSVRVYTHCRECDPVLVRTDAVTFSHDIASEHVLFVDFILHFRSGEPVQVDRTTGTREDMKADLVARGLVVLMDDEPLAIAHRQIRKARERSRSFDTW